MPLYRIVRLALQCILLYNVHISICDPAAPDGGLCPAGEHNLEPCECISMGHKMAGLISIECGPSTKWTSMVDLMSMLNSVDYYPTTHVYRFNMTGTNVDGDIWGSEIFGPLDYREIIMDNNYLIRTVSHDAFYGSNSKDTLTLLRMRNNNMRRFDWDNLQYLPHLYELDLQGNMIYYIDDIIPASELAYLDLSRNYMHDIGPNAFYNLHKLKKLDLSQCWLHSLGPNSFSNPENYNSLQIILSNNQISNISKDAFADVHPALIDLRNNSLKTVQEEVFMLVITSNHHELLIQLTGNPIVCDCEVFWIKDDKIENFFSNFGCYNRFGLPIGVTFHDLDDSYFENCSKNT